MQHQLPTVNNARVGFDIILQKYYKNVLMEKTSEKNTILSRIHLQFFFFLTIGHIKYTVKKL